MNYSEQNQDFVFKQMLAWKKKAEYYESILLNIINVYEKGIPNDKSRQDD